MRQREIVFSQLNFERFKAHLLHDPNREEMALLLTGINEADGVLRLLVREVVPVPREGLVAQSGGYIEASKDFVRPLLERCHRVGLSLVEAHSHPFVDEGVTFSGVDTAGEWRRFPFVSAKSPHIYHATLVVGQRSIDGHLWLRDAQTVIPLTGVRVVGLPLEVTATTSMRPLFEGLDSLEKDGLLASEGGHIDWERFSRQVQAFGRILQQRLAKTTVAVVGDGGIGSHIVQQLAHLGVTNFVLVDHDNVEKSNLHRLVGAAQGDVGIPKVQVASRAILSVNNTARVKAITTPVQDPASINGVKGADIIIGGTDTQLSRLVLNRIATQYMVPYIDCGTGFIKGEKGALEAVGGQVRTVLPDGPCLECMGGINAERVTEELLSPEERRMRAGAGYGLGMDAPQPAVVSLNGVVASLAVTELINLLTAFKPHHPYTFYDALAGRVTPVEVAKNPQCVCCGEGSAVGMGDLQPIGVTGPRRAPPRPDGSRDVHDLQDTGGGPWQNQSQETPTPVGSPLARVCRTLRRRLRRIRTGTSSGLE